MEGINRSRMIKIKNKFAKASLHHDENCAKLAGLKNAKKEFPVFLKA
jgi:hypothetical protein